jgi:hypothetical protein
MSAEGERNASPSSLFAILLCSICNSSVVRRKKSEELQKKFKKYLSNRLTDSEKYIILIMRFEKIRKKAIK